MNMNLSRFANSLISLRKAHWLSQEQVADHLGVSASLVAKWETMERAPQKIHHRALTELARKLVEGSGMNQKQQKKEG